MRACDVVRLLKDDPKALNELLELVASRLHGQAADDVEPVYSSLSLPPDCKSRDVFRKLAPTIPGARKQGKVWIVPVESWTTARRRTPVQTPTDEEIAKQALESFWATRMD